MVLLTRQEVEKEMGAVPGVLLYEFYIKEVNGNDTTYTPIKLENVLKTIAEQN